MSRRGVARGQPLVALSVILMSWVMARALIVEASPTEPELASLAAKPEPAPSASSTIKAPPVEPAPAAKPAPAETQGETIQARIAPRSIATLAPRLAPPRRAIMKVEPASPEALPPQSPQPVPVKVAAGHQLLWMAALSHLPLPVELTPPATLRAAPSPPEPPPFSPPIASRWSGDAWVLYRRDSASLTQGGFLPATYGASQAGAVLRYRLDPGSDHRPAIYLRASSALQSPRDEEAALGFSLRPLAGVPVAALAELRVTQFAAGTSLRPAVLVVTELPAFELPAGFRGEAYAQAGYVGGKAATAFADGQLRADRRAVSIGRAELRLGGGVWAGAQEGVSRVDAGPSATLGIALGGSVSARVAMDWRFRIAGDAVPRSGPAITLSAGF